MRGLTVNTRMPPKHNPDLQEEDIALVPQQLFAGRELKRQLSSSAQTTLLNSLDTIDEVDKLLDSFQEDMTDLRAQLEATQHRELETIPGKGFHCPSSGSLDLQSMIDNESFLLEEGETASSEIAGVSTDAPKMLRPDVHVAEPECEVRDRPSSAPVYTNSAQVPKPSARKPRSLLISKRPVGHRWNGAGLNSVALPRRDGIDTGRSRASTFVDFTIHQELATYKISSDRRPPKTLPTSPETPSPKRTRIPITE